MDTGAESDGADRTAGSVGSVTETTTDIDIAAWQRAVAEAGGAAEPLLTTDELSVVWNRDTNWVRRKLRELIRAGRVECARRSSMTIDGRAVTIPGYRLVNAAAQ